MSWRGADVRADELSRWRQPGWGNYKRASKPRLPRPRGEKKSLAIALLFAPSNCPLNRSIFALPPDRRLCETNSLAFQSPARELDRSRSAAGVQPAPTSDKINCSIGSSTPKLLCRGAASELQSPLLQRRHTLLERDETEAIITKACTSPLVAPQPTHDRTKKIPGFLLLLFLPFLCNGLSCLCSNVDLTSFHFLFVLPHRLLS
ncbi:hypothetical protein GGI35DRAFT_173710 [Trichoderma velutinum]